MPENFSPNVKCPHCGNSAPVAISGFGAEYNNRIKICKKCQKTYYVEIIVKTCAIEPEITDIGLMYDLENQVKYLRKTAKERKVQAETILKAKMLEIKEYDKEFEKINFLANFTGGSC